MKLYKINPLAIITLAILIVTIIVSSTYLYVNFKTNLKNNYENKNGPETAENENKKTESLFEFEKIPLNSCISVIESLKFNYNSYDFWESEISALFPNTDIDAYDVCDYCKLSNGYQLISLNYKEQSIILLDNNNTVLKSTEKFYCRTYGDRGCINIESIADNKAIISCFSSDHGGSLKQIHELNLDTFKFRLIKEEYQSSPL